MDVTLLNSLLTTPSLTDYLDGGSSSSAGTSSTGTTPNLIDYLNANDSTSPYGSSDTFDFSSISQILNQSNPLTAATSGNSSSTSSGSGATGVQAAANNVITNFFTAAGVDTSKLSDSAQKLLQGFQDIITSSGTTARDTTTDLMQEKSNSNLQVYTLTGDNRRLSITVDSSSGTPTLTITDVNGGQVETASMTVGADSTGAASTVNITQTQRQYANGMLQSMTTPDDMSIGLYGS